MGSEDRGDLIKRIQNTLRRESNLSSYDPGEASQSLPSLDKSLSELEPSPPNLRCKQCKARLLRGSESVFCVVCGQSNTQDPPPPPMKFKSTYGYNWFLKYLELNGSELVDPSMRLTQLKGRKTSSKEKIPLSDLIDLELKWPDGDEKLENRSPFRIDSSTSNVFRGRGNS